MTGYFRAVSLLQETEKAQVTLVALGDKLQYYPRDALEARPDLKARLRHFKQELLQVLRGGSTIPQCYACKESRWWRHAREGHWTCLRCHPPSSPDLVGETVEGPESASPAWDPEMSVLVQWFLDHGQHQIPAGSFKLTPWMTVTNPKKFFQAILGDISAGPLGPRIRFSVLKKDLVRIQRLLQGEKSGK